MKDTATGLMFVCFLCALSLLIWDNLTTRWQQERELRETQIRLEQTERTLLLQR
jgi:hypothetical protein